MDLIERASALEIVRRTSGDYATSFAEIGRLPAVDAAPVVRCKSCGKSAVTEMGKRFCNEPLGSRGSVQVEDDDFCSRGERQKEPDAQ
jgi:hypothetical protein